MEEKKSEIDNPTAKATGHFHIAMLQSGNDKFNLENGTTKLFVESSTRTVINNVKTAINQGVTGLN